MILLIQSYRPECRVRRDELQHCLVSNKTIFSKIEKLGGANKRWTYGEIIRLCGEKYYGEKCVIANSDIVFEDTSISDVIYPGQLVALTRWENSSSPRLLGHICDEVFYSGTQDSWGFVAGTIPPIADTCPMGLVGCDQVLVGEAVRAGLRITNPCLTVRTFHVHSAKDRPDRPQVYGLYGYPEVTTDEGGGRVLLHPWPTADGRFEYEWSFYEK